MQVTIDAKKKTMTIVLPLNDPPVESNSGKTFIIAGTGGFQSAGVNYLDKPVSVSINATIKKEK